MNYSSLDLALYVLDNDFNTISNDISYQLEMFICSESIFDKYSGTININFKEIIQKILKKIKDFFDWLFGKFTVFWKMLSKKILKKGIKLKEYIKKIKETENETTLKESGATAKNFLTNTSVDIPNIDLLSYLLNTNKKIYSVEKVEDCYGNTIIYINKNEGDFYLYKKIYVEDFSDEAYIAESYLDKVLDKIKSNKKHYEKILADYNRRKDEWTVEDAKYAFGLEQDRNTLQELIKILEELNQNISITQDKLFRELQTHVLI